MNIFRKIFSKIVFLQSFLDKIFWSRIQINLKLRYKFDALHCGMHMNQKNQFNHSNFRRNIHRIEKGLSFKHMKPFFAESYIMETVEFLKRDNLYCSEINGSTIRWGECVLNLYFQKCEHTEIISQAFKIFKDYSSGNYALGWIPYPSQKRPELTVKYQSLYLLSLRRRSIRDYKATPIDPQVIRDAMRIALLSPSACNRQSFKFLFFNESPIVQKISEIPGGVSGYSIPNIIVIVGRYRGYFDARDINTPLIDASLATMSLMLALETLGVSSVCINWPNLPDREDKIRNFIKLESDEFIIMLLGLGYPQEEAIIPFSAKKEVDSILLVNERII